ncbi:MAG: (2Fe-2S)-binding protein [Pseudomonadota bacterium]
MTAHRARRDAPAAITLMIEGVAVPARAGTSVAAALMAGGRLALRRAARSGAPRGALCLMGVCRECVMLIDGVRRPACMAEARDGMTVDRLI